MTDYKSRKNRKSLSDERPTVGSRGSLKYTHPVIGVARQPEASEHKKPGSTGVSEHITQGIVEGVAPDHDASTANTPESDVLDQAITGAGGSDSGSVKNNEVDDETSQERSAAPDTGDADERSGEPGSSEGDVEDGTKSDTEPAAPVAAEHPETAAETEAS